MRFFKKYKKIKFPLITFYLLILFNPYLFISALEIDNNILENSSISTINNNNIKDKYISKEDSNFYILGPKDEISVNFVGLEFLNGKHVINAEGEIYLPELKTVKAAGKTITELKLELKNKYEEYIFDPDIDIQIIQYRPITFYLNGEVKNPGLYNLTYEEIIPRLFHALQEGQGFTNNANLSKIEVIRTNPESNGGGKIKAEINLISLFDKGEQSLNIRIFDGDTIRVPKTNIPMKEQILKINRTNISPESITIYITGNAISPGPREVKRGSSLIQAIASSGGKKILTGKVEFIRFNYDGEISKSYFRYNPNAKINSKNNPILMDGDLINIRPTLLGKTSQYLKEFSTPILSLYGFYKLF